MDNYFTETIFNRVQLAEYLNIPVKDVESLTVPYFKIGNAVKFCKRIVDEWLRETK